MTNSGTVLWGALIMTSVIIAAATDSSLAKAATGQDLDYSAGSASLQGYLAVDPKTPGVTGAKRPAVLIIHDWMGLGPFAKEKAEKLAHEGYVALAADIYGKGVRPQNPKEAGALAGQYKSDRGLLRERVRAAYEQLAQRVDVDPGRIVVMGYCFGGTTALELARSGARLAGTVSFHGGLSTPTPADAKSIKSPVLALHGADDPNVPPDEVAAFKKEMKDAGVNLTFVAYPGAVHAFTNPAAGHDNSKGAAYNAEADRKSWDELERFLKRTVLSRRPG